MTEPGRAREADRPIGRDGALDRFIGAVAWLSRLGGIAAAALLLAAVLVICQMVLVRYVLHRRAGDREAGPLSPTVLRSG